MLHPDVRGLIVRPRNSSLVLGALHHALYRPANYAVEALSQGRHQLHSAFDPETWGAAAASLGEGIESRLAPAGWHRTERITLENDHLKEIGHHLDSMHASDPVRARETEARLNSVVSDHYNTHENIRSLIAKAHGNSEFAATLHGVKVPSVTGEAGKTLKSVSTDVAAVYGASEIMDKFRSATSSSQEKRSHEGMSKAQEAASHLLEAANILGSLAGKERAYKMASELLQAGLISASELEKHASLFERNPDDAETIRDGMLRGNELESKAANLGEPVGPSEESRRGSRGEFERLCAEASGMLAR